MMLLIRSVQPDARTRHPPSGSALLGAAGMLGDTGPISAAPPEASGPSGFGGGGAAGTFGEMGLISKRPWAAVRMPILPGSPCSRTVATDSFVDWRLI